ncbi:MAG: hypothetical protein Q9162_003203 [Coniocarpon cinnabarinum]
MYQIGNVYVISALAVIGGGLFGFDISSMSAILSEQSYLCYFNQAPYFDPDTGKCKGPTSSVQGGITAAMPGGSFLGAFISGFLTDRIGRKKAIMVACVVWLVGSILACAAQNIGMLVVARVICGICVGIASAQVPTYISELAQPNRRGRLVGAQQWAITWGILIMFYVSYGTSFLDGTASWRLPWGLQMIPGIILLIGLFFTPESPRWLARKGRWDEVQQVVTLVHGKGDPNAPLVAFEMKEIRDMVDFEKANSDVTYFDLFKPHMINRTHIAFFMQVWSQLTGMNVMMYYITYVFTMAGKTSNNVLLSSSIQYIINVVMTVPALLYMDRWGRRPTLLVGGIFMMIWMFANAGILKTYGSPAPPGGLEGKSEASWQVSGSAATGVIACTYLFVASYAPTWGPVSWTYPPELFPMRERGKGTALATMGNWMFNFALAYFVPPAFVNIKWEVYILFGVFLFAMTTHVYFMFPETSLKTLEDTRDVFEDPNGIKYIGTPAWKTKKGHAVRDVENGSFSAQGGFGGPTVDSGSSSGDEKVITHETPGKVA